jgi:hypothetical protein
MDDDDERLDSLLSNRNSRCATCGAVEFIYPATRHKHLMTALSHVPLTVAAPLLLSILFLVLHIVTAVLAIYSRHHQSAERLLWAIVCVLELLCNNIYLGEIGISWAALPRQVRRSFWIMAIMNILAAICGFTAVIAAMAWGFHLQLVIISTAIVLIPNLLVAAMVLYHIWYDNSLKHTIRDEVREYIRSHSGLMIETELFE